MKNIIVPLNKDTLVSNTRGIHNIKVRRGRSHRFFADLSFMGVTVELSSKCPKELSAAIGRYLDNELKVEVEDV